MSFGRVRLFDAGVQLVAFSIVVLVCACGVSLEGLSDAPGRIVPAKYTEGGESRSHDEVQPYPR